VSCITAAAAGGSSGPAPSSSGRPSSPSGPQFATNDYGEGRVLFTSSIAGKERVVSASLKTRAQARAARFMPDSAKAEMHRKMAEPGSAEK
jgi:hypothetical protein